MWNGWSDAPARRQEGSQVGWAAVLALTFALSVTVPGSAAAPAGDARIGAERVSAVLGPGAQLQSGISAEAIVPPAPAEVGGSVVALKAWELLWRTHDDRAAGWSRIHAAEALLQLGQGLAVRSRVMATLREWENSPQRIGAWRVLAAAATSPAERRVWLERIVQVGCDPAAADRLQAVESLGKLGEGVTAPTLASVRAYAAVIPAADALFPFWVLHLSDDVAGTRALVAGLGATDPAVRRRAAFVVRRLRTLPLEIKAALASLAHTEPVSTVAFPSVLAAALVHGVGSGRPEVSWAEFDRLREGAAGAVRLEMIQALLQRRDGSAVFGWAELLEAADPGSRIAGAWAVLHGARLSAGQAGRVPAAAATPTILP